MRKFRLNKIFNTIREVNEKMFRIIKKLYLLQYFDNTGCHYQALN
jgi:hypothetical protein